MPVNLEELLRNGAKTIILSLNDSAKVIDLLNELLTYSIQIILISPRYPLSEWEEIFQIKPDLIIVEQKFETKFPLIEISEIISKQTYKQDKDHLQAKIAIHSSGTVQKKLYFFESPILMKQAEGFISSLDLYNAHFVQSIPLTSIAGINIFFRARAANGKYDHQFPDKNEFKNRIFSLFPTQLRIWGEQNVGLLKELSNARLILLGGEKIDPKTQEIISRYQLPTIETYALTEAGGTVAVRRNKESNFQALPGFTFSSNTAGNLVIHSQLLGDILTSDLAENLTRTTFTKVSRSKNWVVSGGFKFQLSDLEKKLFEDLQIPHLYCEQQENHLFGHQVICYYSSLHLPDELDLWSEKNLPVYMRPKFIQIKDWPLTSTGKTNLPLLRSNVVKSMP